MRKYTSVLLLAFLSSCGSNSSSGSNPTVINPAPIAQAEFEKISLNVLMKFHRCIDINQVSQNMFLTKTSSFNLVHEVDIWNHNGCEANGNQILATQKITSSVAQESLNSVDHNYKDIRLTLLKVELMPLMQSEVDSYNLSNYCGQQWVIAEYRDITNCYSQATAGTVSTMTFKFDINSKRLSYPSGDYYE